MTPVRKRPTCRVSLKSASLQLFKDIVKKLILQNLKARIAAVIVRSCQVEAGQVFAFPF